MGTKIKGIYKYISNIFVEKEAELEIGGPTDVKHVAHIGWEGPSGTAPTWMRDFKTGPEYAATTIGSNGSSLSPWSSQDVVDGMGNQKAAGHCIQDTNSAESVNIPKPKQKRKKNRPSTSSPKSSSSSSRSTRAPKSKSKFVDDNNKTLTIEVKPINIEVA